MAWSFTDLRYGWKIATGIALASATIYIANNTRWRVNQADVIELALGVDERIMALQTGTNAFGAPVYPVARLSFVRNWITNNYETQVVGGVTSVVAVAYTNTVTNTIGYRTDHAMMVELDTKLKTIVPYYVDTNTFLPLTFTGLLASLNLGDGTNFTRTPAIGTNAATYGELPWRIYVQDLQERYKVLNALKVTAVSVINARSAREVRWGGEYLNPGTRPTTYAQAAAEFSTNAWYEQKPPGGDDEVAITTGWAQDGTNYNWTLVFRVRWLYSNVVASSLARHASWVAQATTGTPMSVYETGFAGTKHIQQYNSHGDFSVGIGEWFIVKESNLEAEEAWELGYITPEIVDAPTGPLDETGVYDSNLILGYYIKDSKVISTWQFNYATNRYW